MLFRRGSHVNSLLWNTTLAALTTRLRDGVHDAGCLDRRATYRDDSIQYKPRSPERDLHLAGNSTNRPSRLATKLFAQPTEQRHIPRTSNERVSHRFLACFLQTTPENSPVIALSFVRKPCSVSSVAN